MGMNDRVEKKGRKNTPKEPKAQRFNDAVFVQLELTEEQAKQLKATETSEAEILDTVEEMIENGYKFTIKWDSYGDCVGVFCMPDTDGHENSGLILTGRGSSAFKALKQVLYKHHVLLGRVWATHAGRPNRVVIDD